jgi:Flp pilus assembly protein TadG
MMQLLSRLIADRAGASAVEFALLAPITLMIIIGGMYLSMLGFTAASLNQAVQAGARCFAINTTTCSSATATQTYASGQFMNFARNTATFTASTPSCGKQVTGTVTFKLNAGTSTLNVPLSATACFPV